MESQEINQTINQLEGVFDKLTIIFNKMIELKALDNESRRLKLQEAKGGKQFPSGVLEPPQSAKFVGTATAEDLEESNDSMLNLMDEIFNPVDNARAFNDFDEKFKKDFGCQG